MGEKKVFRAWCEDKEALFETNYLEQDENQEVSIELSIDENDRINVVTDQPVTPAAGIAPPTGVTPTPNMIFLSDNASDIHKALEKLGKYQWLGCAGHHTNLIAQAGFKNIQSAAKIV